MDYQNNGQYPPPQPPAPQNNSNGMAIGALVCGIVGVVFAWIPYFAFLVSAAAIVLGVISRKRLPPGRTGMATAGLVLGIIGAAINVLAIICVVCTAGLVGSMFGEWGNSIDWGHYGF